MTPLEERGPERVVQVPLDTVALEAGLGIPADPKGLVIFAHGSEGSRHSDRNRFVAEQMREGGLATLLLDLLTAEERRSDGADGELFDDIELLGERVAAVVDWAGQHPEVGQLPLGLFGASTGAAAALCAAAARPQRVAAVVGRGGRPDLAGAALPGVRAATLLIVGGEDPSTLALNEAARGLMTGAATRLEIVPGATHLFEEPGALKTVADVATDWFRRHVAGIPPLPDPIYR